MDASQSEADQGRAVWNVYILRCADGSLYTGVATDVQRRLREHNGDGRAGAKYTRARRPSVVVYREAVADRASACRRERQIKDLSRRQKQALIAAAGLEGSVVTET